MRHKCHRLVCQVKTTAPLVCHDRNPNQKVDGQIGGFIDQRLLPCLWLNWFTVFRKQTSSVLATAGQCRGSARGNPLPTDGAANQFITDIDVCFFFCRKMCVSHRKFSGADGSRVVMTQHMAAVATVLTTLFAPVQRPNSLQP